MGSSLRLKQSWGTCSRNCYWEWESERTSLDYLLNLLFFFSPDHKKPRSGANLLNQVLGWFIYFYIMRKFAALALRTLVWLLLTGPIWCQKPAVNIGAVFTFNSVIGRAAKPAMEAAISHINADPKILDGTQLKLLMEDANCSGFLGTVGGIYPLSLPSLSIYCSFASFLSCLSAAPVRRIVPSPVYLLPSSLRLSCSGLTQACSSTFSFGFCYPYSFMAESRTKRGHLPI